MTATLHETTSTGPTDVLCWRRTFPGRTDQARVVRAFVAFLLDGCPYVDDAVQVVAELAGNALIHTRSGLPGGGFVVEVRRWQHGLAVSVTDQGGLDDPARRPAEYDGDGPAESGRGLPIVADLATSVVWAGDGRHGRTITAFFT